MDKYLLKLKAKYGYSDELLSILEKLVPYFKKEFNVSEDIIFNALLECEIHIQGEFENITWFLKEYFGVYGDDITNVKLEFPAIGRANTYKYVFTENGQIFSKRIIYLATKILYEYNSFFKKDHDLSAFIFELCHLIKGYNKSKIEDGKLVDSSGLSRHTYLYDAFKGNFEVNSFGIGIENALNEVDASNIFHAFTGREYKPTYSSAFDCIKALLKNKKMAEVIRNSQKNGDDNWIRYLGEDDSKVLIDNFDFLVYNRIPTPEYRFNFDEKVSEACDAVNRISGKR